MIALALLTVAHSAIAPLSIIPKPSEIALGDGQPFRVSRRTRISADKTCADEVQLLRKAVQSAGGGLSSGDIHVGIDATLPLGEEGYRLQVAPNHVEIKGKTATGAFYGVQSLLQMLPAEGGAGVLPNCVVTDQPKFPWRGTMLDVSRHFFPPADVKRLLDLMAMQKMNTFHWHLVDDGGWRVEIKKYPNLTRTGAFRKPTDVLWSQGLLSFPGPNSGQKLYGGFYTQAEVRDIVRYATKLHITIIPEIELPGHSMAAVASYPEIGCAGTTPAQYLQATGNAFPNVYCAGKEKTFAFLEGVLDEVIDLFPSKTIHIGGDEVDKYLWNHCSDCQHRMSAEGLKTPEELQSYFIRRIEKYVNAKGRRIIGWDEILEGGLAPNAQVMSWRGIDGGVAAANAGHDVVMSPTSHCYFDYPYVTIPTDHVLTFDPVPAGLSAEAKAHILGGQCNLWTESVTDRKTVDVRLFPRILAMAEVLWSGRPDQAEFQDRLSAFYPRLEAKGVDFFVERPESEYNAIILGDDAKVVFRTAPGKGSVIRYTTDGTEPTATSPIYTEPLRPTKPMVVTGAIYFAHGQRSDSLRIAVLAPPVEEPANLAPGLAYSFFQGEWTRLPDFSKLAPKSSGILPSIGLTPESKGDDYGFTLDGYLRIPETGAYTFFISSDDGSDFSLGGAVVIDHDGLHAAVEKLGRAQLRKGLYPLHIRFFQADGGQSLRLKVQGPGLEKQPVPASWLLHS